MNRFFLLLLLSFQFVVQGQIITTFAGTGSNIYSGNGVAATAAGIPDPCKGVFDNIGNYFFADQLGSNRIRRVDISGQITTVAGCGIVGFTDNIQATDCDLNLPKSITLDASGNLYIADAGNFRIRKVDKGTGIISTIAGTDSSAFSGDNGPASSASLNDPLDLCFDKYGNLYIADGFNYRVRKINKLGIISTFAGNGGTVSTGDGGPATSAQLGLPIGLVSDDIGNIYIAETVGNRVRKVDTFGIITTIAGNGIATYLADNIPATMAQINPIRLAINFGQIFIADEYNRRVYRIDLAGILHLVAGNGMGGFSGDGGVATATSLDYPAGVAFDTCGNLYIPEPSNRRIRKVSYPHCHYLRNENHPNVNLSIYPNPSNDFIKIDNLEKTSNYRILNIVGSMMLHGILKEGNNIISLNTVPKGMYILEIISNEDEKRVIKIVKE